MLSAIHFGGTTPPVANLNLNLNLKTKAIMNFDFLDTFGTDFGKKRSFDFERPILPPPIFNRPIFDSDFVLKQIGSLDSRGRVCDLGGIDTGLRSNHFGHGFDRPVIDSLGGVIGHLNACNQLRPPIEPPCPPPYGPPAMAGPDPQAFW